MKNLYVGCRVRIVRSFGGGMLGVETRITRWRDDARRISGERYSGWEVEASNRHGRRAVCIPEWLEPIQDPGHKTVTWEECLWQPGGVAA